MGLATDSAGKIFVADVKNNRIQKLTSGGIFQSKITGASAGDNFLKPYGMAVDSSGNVYVADTGNHRIVKFTLPSAPVTYTVTGSVNGGNGTISCTSPVVSGSSAKCTIAANAGYSLWNMYDGKINVTTQVVNNVYTISSVTANHTVTATFAPSCNGAFTLVPASRQFTQGAGSDSVSVVGPGNCTWTAVSNDAWISITSRSATGTGNGTVEYAVSANTSTSTRTGTITIAEQTFTVTQTGQTATYTLTVTKAGTGDCTITSSPSPLTWNGNIGLIDYAVNTQASLTATPASGSIFMGWTGCDSSSTASTCTVVMASAKGITAQCNKAGARYDFNGDGRSDLVFEHFWDNHVYMWLVNGLSHTGKYVYQNLPKVWRIVSVADFNGDDKADILLQHTDNGALVIWLLNGNSIADADYVALSVGAEWQVAGTGDFDANGKADILFRNSTTGDTYLWFISNTSIVGADYVMKSLPLHWQIKAVGDFDGNGKADILLYNVSTGDVFIWFMDGTKIVSGDFVTKGLPSSWQLSMVGDFNGDGKDDVVLRNITLGAVVVWLMDGASIREAGYLVHGLNSDWEFK